MDLQLKYLKSPRGANWKFISLATEAAAAEGLLVTEVTEHIFGRIITARPSSLASNAAANKSVN